ncbi:hypothetical protein R1flu_019054 [Riccia fluitans]|uniref:DUF4100 domain-containing protein n=1 Tax=Riccia fluitans TaxID=41844 RepID=A0ABD1ZHK7_9MARC
MAEFTSKPVVKEKATTKEKDKGPAYTFQFDIEAATDLREVLEEHILNAKIEFSLREILGITKEFHDVIINVIERKRQLIGESTLVNMLDIIISREEEEKLFVVCQQSTQKRKNL